MANMKRNNDQKSSKMALGTSVGIAFGGGVGIILGIVFGQTSLWLALGIGIGMVVGVGVGFAMDQKNKDLK